MEHLRAISRNWSLSCQSYLQLIVSTLMEGHQRRERCRRQREESQTQQHPPRDRRRHHAADLLLLVRRMARETPLT